MQYHRRLKFSPLGPFFNVINVVILYSAQYCSLVAYFYFLFRIVFSPVIYRDTCRKRQKPQAPIRNRQTRKVANAKGLNRNTNLT